MTEQQARPGTRPASRVLIVDDNEDAGETLIELLMTHALLADWGA
jgi:hypoxanthine phosphoribosyltransferase